MEKIPVVYFSKLRNIEEKIHILMEKQDELNENLISFNNYLQDQNFLENKYELKSFLYLIASISNNCHRSKHFFTIIESILKKINLQGKIQNNFTNFEIFNIFQKNKRLLLFLFNSKVIIPTEEIYSIFINNQKFIEGKYIEFFFPEFEQFMDEGRKNSIRNEIQELKNQASIEEFNKKRDIGENDHYFCYLIQKDLVIDFITYKEKNNISPNSTIKSSIYETNLFLINKNPTLIQYSIFCGSIQITNYLNQQNVTLNSSIWPFAIHGRNAEIIYFLEENKINTIHRSYQYLIVESIKCHHNEITDYFRTNFCDEEKIYDFYLYRKALKYYNFQFLTNDMVNSLINSCKFNQQLNIPYYLSKYDYYLILEFVLNCKTIVKKFIFNLSKNALDINYLYTVYKPVVQPNNDVIDYIAIKNNDIDQDLYDYERKEDYYLYLQKTTRNYTKYKYDVETSTILNVAARKRNIDIIKLLLNMKKIDVNIKSTKLYKKKYQTFDDYYFPIKEERTVLHEAVESGYSEVVQLLLKNKTFDVNSALIKTTMYEDVFSTANTCYLKKNEKILLHLAIEKGYIEIIKLLLSNPTIDINMKSKSEIRKSGGCICYCRSLKTRELSSLFYAIENGNINVIEFLLTQPNIDVNFGLKEYLFNHEVKGEIVQEKVPLYLAVENQNLEIVQLLIKQPNIVLNYVSKTTETINYEKRVHEITALELAREKPNLEIRHLLSK